VFTKLDIWVFFVLIHIICNKSVKVFRDRLIAFLKYNLGKKKQDFISGCAGNWTADLYVNIRPMAEL